MAGNDSHLSEEIDALPVDDDHWIELGLDNNIKIQLRKIKNDFESIFSWDIHKLSGFNHDLKFNIIGKVQEKQEMITNIENTDTDNEFIFYRFFLQLITIHEDYMCKRYKKAYLAIENIVQFLETCTFDKSDKQYSDAYCHIARATNVYIALTLKIDSEKLLNDIKQIKSFNCAEKAAICAVKARIFMEYPPKGNDIALEFADRARNFYSTEPEWLLIWLKAKKRVRHRYEPYKSPGVDEIRDAELLCSMEPYPKFLIHIYQLYKEAGFVHKMNNNLQLSNKFYKLSSDIAKKSIELAKDDKKHMDSILLHYIHFPKYLVSKDFIDNVITKLTNVKNSIVQLTIGRYYLNREKNYEKAKIYFTRGKEYGNFNSALQLIKVECLLEKSVLTLAYVQKLNEMYKFFQNPKNRIIILTHILIYYNYYDYNPKDMMNYLKLYIDQDIEDTIKKSQLMYVRPLFNDDRLSIKANEFLNVLSVNIKKLMHNNNWDTEEKNILDQFNKILKLNIDDNRFNNGNKTAVFEDNKSWRKKRVDMSDNKYNDSHPQKKESWRKQQNSRHAFDSHLSNELHKKDNTEDYSNPDFT